VFRSRREANRGSAVEQTLRCSFCNKTQEEVRKLIAGPTVFICDDCVQVCVEIMSNELSSLKHTEENRTAEAQPLASSQAGNALVSCALCDASTPIDALLLVRDRGGLCPACVVEVEAALAGDRASDS